MPFLGHSQYDGLDVSPDTTPPAIVGDTDPLTRARLTVRRFSAGDDDEAMLLELLGLVDAEPV